MKKSLILTAVAIVTIGAAGCQQFSTMFRPAAVCCPPVDPCCDPCTTAPAGVVVPPGSYLPGPGPLVVPGPA